MSTEHDHFNRPLYTSDVNFATLAVKDEGFSMLLAANMGKLDFKQPAHVMHLTKSILKVDFCLDLEMPNDRLCPPIPVRFNYVRWIQDLIDTTMSSFTETYDTDKRVIGLDIGVGASNIYSLLALSSRPAWRMCGIDIDPTNFSYASRNTECNNLGSRMRLLQTSPSGPLIPLSHLGIGSLDFVMCNPPFFSSTEEMQSSLVGEGKAAAPSAICTGAPVEMVSPGGDLGFVLRIIDESLRLRTKVQWYSSMLGKWSSTQRVVERIREIGVSNYAVCALRAGGKTTRWAVAWSFADLRPKNEVARRGMTVKDILPFPTEHTLPFEAAAQTSADQASKTVHETLKDLDLSWEWQENIKTGIALTRANVWSRAARRDRGRREAQGVVSSGIGSEEVALAVKIKVGDSCVLLRWLQGNDQVLWESFCGMLVRALRSAS